MTDKESIGDRELLLKQYEIYVEMADRTSARRGETNKFYVTLLTGFLALIALAFEKNWFQQYQNQVLIVAAGLGFGLWGHGCVQDSRRRLIRGFSARAFTCGLVGRFATLCQALSDRRAVSPKSPKILDRPWSHGPLSRRYRIVL